MRIMVVVGVALALTGCVGAQPTYTADGHKGHLITCPGTALNWGFCYQKAGELCGARGFDILEKVGETGSYATANAYGGSAGTTRNRMMIVQCRGPEPTKAKTKAA